MNEQGLRQDDIEHVLRYRTVERYIDVHGNYLSANEHNIIGSTLDGNQVRLKIAYEPLETHEPWGRNNNLVVFTREEPGLSEEELELMAGVPRRRRERVWTHRLRTWDKSEKELELIAEAPDISEESAAADERDERRRPRRRNGQRLRHQNFPETLQSNPPLRYYTSEGNAVYYTPGVEKLINEQVIRQDDVENALRHLIEVESRGSRGPYLNPNNYSSMMVQTVDGNQVRLGVMLGREGQLVVNVAETRDGNDDFIPCIGHGPGCI